MTDKVINTYVTPPNFPFDKPVLTRLFKAKCVECRKRCFVTKQVFEDQGRVGLCMKCRVSPFPYDRSHLDLVRIKLDFD